MFLFFIFQILLFKFFFCKLIIDLVYTLVCSNLFCEVPSDVIRVILGLMPSEYQHNICPTQDQVNLTYCCSGITFL